MSFIPDGGRDWTNNYPNQDYKNGVDKNTATARTYKRVIRILKRLRNEMREQKVAGADGTASYLIECLVWNAPNKCFVHDDFYDILRDVLAHTFNNTRTDELCGDWMEVNECKYLFGTHQPWTRAQAHNFLSACWDYIGYE